jgi:hypothetical protein
LIDSEETAFAPSNKEVLTMRVLVDLCGIIVAGFRTFFVGIALIACMILLWLCGIAGSLMLLVSAFAATMYAITGKHHDLTLALGYLCYAAVPFVIIFALTYYQGKIVDSRKQRLAYAPVGL